MQFDEKITELEVKLAYLEDYIEKLNSVIIEQGEKISTLHKNLEQVKMQLQAKSDDIRPIEKPPHY